MFLGWHPQGAWVPIPVCTGTAWPTDASGGREFPELMVFDVNGDVVTRGESIVPITNKTGMHIIERQMGPEFSPGIYTAVVSWPIASNTQNRSVTHTFEVTEGGDPLGAYVGLQFYPAPNADFLVGMLDCGRIETRKGPKA